MRKINKARSRWFKSGKSQGIKGCKKNRARKIEVSSQIGEIERKYGLILTVNQFLTAVLG